eukprot:6819176-Pyramimonas_sp.AAC.1
MSAFVELLWSLWGLKWIAGVCQCRGKQEEGVEGREDRGERGVVDSKRGPNTTGWLGNINVHQGSSSKTAINNMTRRT